MYITRVEIKNIRSIRHLEWDLKKAKKEANPAGWHVILGDNGSGKSTFVRSVALTLLGSRSTHNRDIFALRQDWDSWLNPLALNKDEKERSLASIETHFALNKEYDTFDTKQKAVRIQIYFNRFFDNDLGDEYSFMPLTSAFGQPSHDEALLGWFSASYGPFRRFSGSDIESAKLFGSRPNLARHSTCFGENIALVDVLSWLKDLKFKSLEDDQQAGSLINTLTAFINQPGFLPNATKLINVSSRGIHFVDGNGGDVLIEELSDGYRSILSLTLDLIRQLYLAYGADIFDNPLDSGMNEVDPDRQICVKVPGVVQIDEVDAHLHPTWQKQIGFWLTKHFPQIQFIVTTHSPLVCQAAERGSIYRLPTPGTEETGHMLKGADLNRLLYGNILDAYSTEAFGSGVTRSVKSEEMLNRLAALNIKEITEGLTKAEAADQEELRAALPSTASALPDGFLR